MELDRALRERGSQLVLVPGKSVDVVPELVRRLSVQRVHAQRWVEPFARERDRRVAESLRESFVLHEGELLLPPGSLRSGSGGPYAVFTHFAKAFMRQAPAFSPLPTPKRLPNVPAEVAELSVPIPSCSDLGFERNERLLEGGERKARARLKKFLGGAASQYKEERDRLDLNGTSRLSADLHFGTLSVRQVWSASLKASEDTVDRHAFLNELLWREFAHSTLWDRPELLEKPFREKFAGFPWQTNEAHWRAWADGRTGYPIVDAAARQLLGEGFVHNRARMIAASFLTKHLLIDYRKGEAHYLKYLTDGDWASNNAGWQWSAGCGCDAQPYFRVFNPVTQGKKFDPYGDYVRRWVPELGGLPARTIHCPWEASPLELRAANVRLGENYPEPIVEHRFARERFLGLAAEHLRT